VSAGPPDFELRVLAADERPWLAEHLRLAWGGSAIVSRGRVHDAARLPALVAVAGDELVGLATFHMPGRSCELVTLEAFRRHAGIGSAILKAIARYARRRGCDRLWLVTTNDNLDALRFYQRRGLRLVAVHRGAVDEARQVKPSIPLVGEHGIEIHDELELEMVFPDGPQRSGSTTNATTA
jgi:GNAT superfamily N-acetyltransferase